MITQLTLRAFAQAADREARSRILDVIDEGANQATRCAQVATVAG